MVWAVNFNDCNDLGEGHLFGLGFRFSWLRPVNCVGGLVTTGLIGGTDTDGCFIDYEFASGSSFGATLNGIPINCSSPYSDALYLNSSTTSKANFRANPPIPTQ